MNNDVDDVYIILARAVMHIAQENCQQRIELLNIFYLSLLQLSLKCK